MSSSGRSWSAKSDRFSAFLGPVFEYSTVVAAVIRFGDVVMLEIFLLHKRAVSGNYEMK
jgi:hypothetical protein